MPRMRIRSAAVNFAPSIPSYSFGSPMRGASNDGGEERRGSFGEAGIGVGDTSNRAEKRSPALDRWRKLYYDIRVSQHADGHKKNTLQLTGRYSKKPPRIKMASFNPLKWKMRTFVYVFLGLLALYIFIIHKKTHHVNFEFIVKNSKPQSVWDFVVDFSNMVKLNPTIEDFDVGDESRDHEHWKYSVQYTEHLSHFPTIKNTAHGHFVVKQEGNVFLVKSSHRTCFYGGLYCLDSESDFKFTGRGSDTKCVEEVQYQCPLIFSNLCHREVMYQRQEIMKNLKSHFAMTSIRIEDDK